MKDMHTAARDAYLLWKFSGRSRQGVMYDLMRKSRSRFKYALRVCKNNKNVIVADNLADKLCKKDDREFWRHIKNVTNSKVKLPSRVGDAHGSADITTMWKEHYNEIFNMVTGSNCTELYTELCDVQYVTDKSMSVYPSEISEIIKDLPCNKSPGLDGLMGEHLKYANGQLSVLLSILLSAILAHGHVPNSVLKSVLVPIIKNKNKRITDNGNYRPICLANVFTKVIEQILLSRLQNWLSTTCNQFGFKSKHGTEMCVFILKELIRYYIKHGSCMYVTYLDASKAFDRVNHHKLFTKLITRSAPKWIVRLLCQWYCNQCICVRWESVISDFFPVNNGVRQGGILSPLLFNMYMDELSVCLHKLPIGCCSGDIVVNHLMYADDIVLLAPSAKGMQTIIETTYAYGNTYDIVFNITKSQVMFYDTLKMGQPVNISLGDTVLTVTQSYKYLGHIITNNLSDEADIVDKIRGLYGRSNMLLRKFYFCSDHVKNKLFMTYCNNIYLCSLWVKCRKICMRNFIVSYNNAFRILHGLPMRCSASGMFAESNVDSCQAQIRRSIHSLRNRLDVSLNVIARSVVNSDVHITSSLHHTWIRTLYTILL